MQIIYFSELGAPQIRIDNAFEIDHLAVGKTHQNVLVSKPFEPAITPQNEFEADFDQIRQDLRSRGWNGQLTSIVVLSDTNKDFGYLKQLELATAE